MSGAIGGTEIYGGSKAFTSGRSSGGWGLSSAFTRLEKLAREQPDVRSLRLYMHVDNFSARRTYEKLGMHQTKYEVFELEFDAGASIEGAMRNISHEKLSGFWLPAWVPGPMQSSQPGEVSRSIRVTS